MIIFLKDGAATVGVTSRQDILANIERYQHVFI